MEALGALLGVGVTIGALLVGTVLIAIPIILVVGFFNYWREEK